MITDTENFKTISLDETDDMAKVKALLQRYESAKDRRDEWTSLWQDCYDYALPQRGGFNAPLMAGKARTNQIYDGTAMDAAEQLAASLLGNLTPIWSQWFGLKPGPDLSPAEADALAPILEKAGKQYRHILIALILLLKYINAIWIWWSAVVPLYHLRRPILAGFPHLSLTQSLYHKWY